MPGTRFGQLDGVRPAVRACAAIEMKDSVRVSSELHESAPDVFRREATGALRLHTAPDIRHIDALLGLGDCRRKTSRTLA